ncbi:hypothetical protein P43SY_002724 [Pythium insidiosum]|uniref:Uncharacterized protein n=1 Tax=Pythium insidiosum TaxID=114742 RepID=A0AAD5LUL9_PYTIN|nr:hypothetical protein P43SY_002724 [Pythium insidiosum]
MPPRSRRRRGLVIAAPAPQAMTPTIASASTVRNLRTPPRVVYNPGHGFLEHQDSPFPVRRAFCNRHRHCRDDVRSLLAKITSRHVTSTLPRDAVTRLQAINRRVESYSSAETVLRDIFDVLVETCEKQRQQSKTEPPAFSMKHLQVLQLVADHVPQLRLVHAPSLARDTAASDPLLLISSKELRRVLRRTFDPVCFIRKYAGPLHQTERCMVCEEPFQLRQHIYYCCNEREQHAQHWKCTRQKDVAASKKTPDCKTVPLVRNGVWAEVALPKGLPGVADTVSCGICRSPIDCSAVLADRRDSSRVAYERPRSAYEFGGCVVNMDTIAAADLALQSTGAIRSSQVMGTLTTASTNTSKSSKRSGALSDSGKAATEKDTLRAAGVIPPKMDRVNVRRTTRWIACLAQVIRLVQDMERGGVTDEATEQSTPEGTADSIVEVVSDDSNRQGGNNGTVDCEEPTEAGTQAPEVIQQPGEAQNEQEQETQERPEDHPQNKEAVDDATEPMSVSRVTRLAAADASPASRLPPLVVAYLEDAKSTVRPFDAYALRKMERAQKMLEQRNGPGLSLLHALIQEYTRFMYIKHARAAEKAAAERRRQEELDAQAERDRERKRQDREAELALKKQMLAMRKRQRQQLKKESGQ